MKAILSSRNFFVVLIALFCLASVCRAQSFAKSQDLSKPVSVYINWAAYDELSDTVRLSETLAMKQLEQVVRLKKQGAIIDYYMMDAFWFEKSGNYRVWRKKDWPNGYNAWLKACQAAGIKPGLWFSVNYIFPASQFILDANIDAWKSSLSKDGKGLCLFDGGYLQHFMETLDMYAREGFRMFKFDFMDMNAVTPRWEGKMTRDEIIRANFSALRTALIAFRKKHPEVLLIGYNGFGGEISNTGVPIRQTIEKEWLHSFHTMYCGDPRPADVPARNFWRSKDIYSDHMVRYYMANGFPLKKIDNAGFMIGKTGTCYYRGKAAWKGMLLLSLARGGWMNTYYGDMSLLTNKEGKWFAKAQRLFYPLQQTGTTQTFGGLPGKSEPYGYSVKGKSGGLITVVNPSLQHQTIALPANAVGRQRLLFTDSGYEPVLTTGHIRLGPEQMAVIGYGSFATQANILGKSEDVQIVQWAAPLETAFKQEGNVLKVSFTPSQAKTVRLVFQQFNEQGIPVRSTGGSPPHGIPLGKLLTIRAEQDGKELPLQIQYDKAIWSGLSWAVAEVDSKSFHPDKPISVQFTSSEKNQLTLKGQVFLVDYNK